MTASLVPRGAWEQGAVALVEEYAGFVAAEGLSPAEQVVALASLVPMALAVVDEARDTIERLNRLVDELRGEDNIEDAVIE